jgi:hypothetical protein
MTFWVEISAWVSKNSNADLFWALRGGGPSTYGVITKVTYKVHPRPSLVPCIITFHPSVTIHGLSYESYYQAMACFYAQSPKFNDFGIGGYPLASKYGYTGPFVAANRTYEEVQAFLDPIEKYMKDKYNVSFSYFTMPEDIIDKVVRPASGPADNAEAAGRYWVPQVTKIFSRAALQEENISAIYNFVKTSLEDGAIHHPFPNILGIAYHNRAWDFSLNTAWKTGATHIIVTNSNWNNMQDIRNLYDRMGKEYLPSMDKLAENHAAYINEVCLH